MKRTLVRTVTAAVLLLLIAGSSACPAAAPAAEGVKVDDLVKRCLPAYVFVGGGSGAIISPDGYVITNAHVTRRSKRWKLRTAAGQYYPAWVVGISPGTDLALLKIDHAENLPYLPLGNSDKMEIGDMVIAVGNPFALGNVDGKPTVTLGVVSALHVDRPHAYDALQTDTPINPGNSGGPLINLKGELVGVNAQIQTRFGLRQNTGVGYAISANQVSRFLPVLKKADGREVRSGKIPGVVLETRPDEPAVIKEVRAGSEAVKLGIQKGDVICGVDKAEVANVRDLASALGRYPIGVDVMLRVRRGDPAEEHTLKITISKYGRTYIGTSFTRKNRRSLEIGSVDPGSPAAKAKIRPGDTLAGMIVGRRSFRIRSRRAYYAMLRRLRPGMAVRLVVRRGGKNVPVSLIIGEKD